MTGGTPAVGPRDLRSALRAAVADLAAAGVPSPEHDARALAAHVLGVDRLPALLPGAADGLPDGFAEAFADVVARRRAREPLQHITGSAGFRHLELRVRPGVFVPRPETETVAQVAVDEAAAVVARGRPPLVADLCCGAGGIAVAVATEVPGAVVVAVDVSPDAVALAGENARRHGAAVRVVRGDVADPGLLADLAGGVDVVVANPPYIPPDGVPVDPEVRDHDPALALYGGGPDGLDVPRAVVGAAARLLRPGGLLVMEHGDVQGPAVRRLVAAAGGFDAPRTLADLAGRDRMVVARRVRHEGPAPTCQTRVP